MEREHADREDEAVGAGLGQVLVDLKLHADVPVLVAHGIAFRPALDSAAEARNQPTLRHHLRHDRLDELPGPVLGSTELGFEFVADVKKTPTLIDAGQQWVMANCQD